LIVVESVKRSRREASLYESPRLEPLVEVEEVEEDAAAETLVVDATAAEDDAITVANVVG